MHVKERNLNQPEEEEGDHASTGDTLRGWNSVWKSAKARPDGRDHNFYDIAAVDGLYRESEDGEDDS